MPSRRLRQSEYVDYAGVARAKVAGLRLAYERFRTAPSADRRERLQAFRANKVGSFRSSRALKCCADGFPKSGGNGRNHGAPPREALVALRTSDEKRSDSTNSSSGSPTASLPPAGPGRGAAADRALPRCRCRGRCRRRRRLERTARNSCRLVRRRAAGPVQPGGQNWGHRWIPPPRPGRGRFQPFRRTIAAAMRHAGAIRIDHVLGLNRLFLMPHGATPLRRLLPLPARGPARGHGAGKRTYRCIVIGEDLGTVPRTCAASSPTGASGPTG